MPLVVVVVSSSPWPNFIPPIQSEKTTFAPFSSSSFLLQVHLGNAKSISPTQQQPPTLLLLPRGPQLLISTPTPIEEIETNNNTKALLLRSVMVPRRWIRKGQPRRDSPSFSHSSSSLSPTSLSISFLTVSPRLSYQWSSGASSLLLSPLLLPLDTPQYEANCCAAMQSDNANGLRSCDSNGLRLFLHTQS